MARVIENPKQLILNKAKEILYSGGYNKLSMRSISKECGIALGTIYNYYPTKKDLVVDMMTDYWRDCFMKINVIINSDYSFYEILHHIFTELGSFINTFKTEWLKPELYDNPDYVEGGIEKENIYIHKLVVVIENSLKKEMADSKVQCKLDSYDISKFIVMSFITMIQMPIFEYSSFEEILKTIIF